MTENERAAITETIDRGMANLPVKYIVQTTVNGRWCDSSRHISEKDAIDAADDYAKVVGKQAVRVIVIAVNHPNYF